jgi:hypothetical protein
LTELPAGGRTGIPLSLHVVAEPSGAEKGYVLRAVGQLPAAVVTDWLRFAMTAAKTAPVSGKP